VGQFLSMSGVVGAEEAAVVDALREYATGCRGTLQEAELTTEDDGCLVVSEGVGGVSVLYPHGFLGWDDSARDLSERLGRPVFHIHDSDLWMYLLFEHGEVVDQFNPVPEYWGELDEDERRSWKGDATAVAKRVQGLSAEQIAKYLIPWGDEVFEADERTKAYPTDRHVYGVDWQLIDFMNRWVSTTPSMTVAHRTVRPITSIARPTDSHLTPASVRTL
jgi:hypothetical protein